MSIETDIQRFHSELWEFAANTPKQTKNDFGHRVIITPVGEPIAMAIQRGCPAPWWKLSHRKHMKWVVILMDLTTGERAIRPTKRRSEAISEAADQYATMMTGPSLFEGLYAQELIDSGVLDTMDAIQNFVSGNIINDLRMGMAIHDPNAQFEVDEEAERDSIKAIHDVAESLPADKPFILRVLYRVPTRLDYTDTDIRGTVREIAEEIVMRRDRGEFVKIERNGPLAIRVDDEVSKLIGANAPLPAPGGDKLGYHAEQVIHFDANGNPKVEHVPARDPNSQFHGEHTQQDSDEIDAAVASMKEQAKGYNFEVLLPTAPPTIAQRNGEVPYPEPPLTPEQVAERDRIEMFGTAPADAPITGLVEFRSKGIPVSNHPIKVERIKERTNERWIDPEGGPFTVIPGKAGYRIVNTETDEFIEQDVTKDWATEKARELNQIWRAEASRASLGTARQCINCAYCDEQRDVADSEVDAQCAAHGAWYCSEGCHELADADARAEARMEADKRILSIRVASQPEHYPIEHDGVEMHGTLAELTAHLLTMRNTFEKVHVSDHNPDGRTVLARMKSISSTEPEYVGTNPCADIPNFEPKEITFKVSYQRQGKWVDDSVTGTLPSCISQLLQLKDKHGLVLTDESTDALAALSLLRLGISANSESRPNPNTPVDTVSDTTGDSTNDTGDDHPTS